MRFTLPYPPSTNNLYATVRGHRVKTKAARDYKQAAGIAAAAAGCEMLPGNVSVSVRLTVYRPRRAGDLDNLLKSVLDSLTGIAWKDDSQVGYIEARRSEDKANPRVEIEIEATCDHPRFGVHAARESA